MGNALKFVPTLLPRLHVRRVHQEGSGAARQGRVVTVSGNARERVEATARSSTPPKPDPLDTPPFESSSPDPRSNIVGHDEPVATAARG